MNATLMDERRPTLQELSQQAQKSAGFVCSHCGSDSYWVTKTRDGRDSIKRVRECRKCGKKVWTRETIVTSE